jgi:hypothetical protein
MIRGEEVSGSVEFRTRTSLGSHQSLLVQTLGKRADSIERSVSAVHDRNHLRLVGHRIPLAGLHTRQETVEEVLRSRLAGHHTVLGTVG